MLSSTLISLKPSQIKYNYSENLSKQMTSHSRKSQRKNNYDNYHNTKQNQTKMKETFS